MARQYNNYADIIDFTRASSGTALTKVSYGEELVQDTGFDDPSYWMTAGESTVSGGIANVLSTAGAYSDVRKDLGLNQTSVYVLQYEVVGSPSGTIGLGNDLTNANRVIPSTVGTHTVIFRSALEFVAIKRLSGCDVDITSISVREVTFGTGALTLFNPPVNVPRIEYDADGNLLGLLVEEARTNLFPYSLISESVWSLNNVSLTANTEETVAPDGTYTATKVIADSLNTICYFNNNLTITAGTTYTQSVYVKAGETSWFQIAPSTGFDSVFQNYDLASGVLGYGNAGGIASITPVGDDWYRCTLTVTAQITTSNGRMVLVWMSGNDGRVDSDGTFSPDGVKGFYAWGAQLEVGSFPTSYIKSNSGSATTRSADVASIDVADFGYNQSEGTVVVEATISHEVIVDQRYVVGSDQSSARWLYKNDSQDYIASFDGAAVLAVQQKTLSDSVPFKSGLSTGQTERFLAVNGHVNTGVTNGNIPSLTGELRFGCDHSNTKQLNGHIKKLIYIPRRVTNAQLISLTE
jgi:hypothetical protein